MSKRKTWLAMVDWFTAAALKQAIQFPRQDRRKKPHLERLDPRLTLAADVLYVGDAATDTVQKFDAASGAYLGQLVAPNSAGLHGPRGLVFDQGQMLVVNQNVDLPKNGEVLRYHGQTGASTGALVPASDPNAPFSPAGIVVRNQIVYVADTGQGSPSGRIAKYDANTGVFLGNLVPREPVPNAFEAPFRPRGLAFGPRDQLYVTVFSETTFGTDDPAGYVLGFDVDSGDYRVVAHNNGNGIAEPGEVTDLHNPEGLAFGPNGDLFVTSSRGSASDTDKILRFDAIGGGELGWTSIPLDSPGGPRAFAQFLLFGPDGALFVPITGGGPDAGAVRRYDVERRSFDVFIPGASSGGVMTMPFYATFGQTDPATLNYTDPPTLSDIEASTLLLNGPLTTDVPYSGRLTSSLKITDLDGTLSRAVVRISSHYQQNQDALRVGFDNFGTIAAHWDVTTGTLTLQGVDTVENYRNALQSVTYSNSSTTPDRARRTVTFSVSDGTTDSNTVSRDIVLLEDDLNALFYIQRWQVALRTMDIVIRLNSNASEGSIVSVVPGREEGGLLLANRTTLLAAGREQAPREGEGEEGSAFPGSAPRGAVYRLPDRTKLVGDGTLDAPVDPEGMALDGETLYVADTRSSQQFSGQIPAGRIRRYKVATGEFLNDITASGYDGLFHPRGLVFGPDGSLYVSLYDPNLNEAGEPIRPGYGAILKIDSHSPSPVVVAFNNGDAVVDAGETPDLHRPGSLVFGPDGNLYVATRSSDPNGLDSIVKLDPSRAYRQVDTIPIARVGQTPIHPRGLLFGPDGKLFVSANEPDNPLGENQTRGYLRSYDVTSKDFTLIASNDVGPIGYFTFGYTNPKTLAFEPPSGAAPVLSGIENADVEMSNDSAKQITAALTVADADSTVLVGAKIRITEGYRSNQDALVFTDTSTISGQWDGRTATLTLVGTDTLANYEAALRDVKFSHRVSETNVQNPIAGTRTVLMEVNDGVHASNVASRQVRVSLLRGDYLYVGDQGNDADPGDDSVRRFDLFSNSLAGTFVAPGQLVGPRGIVFHGGSLLAVNQNVNTEFNGELLRFDGKSGAALNPALVSAQAAQAPFAPRGIVVKDGIVYLADFLGTPSPRIAKYNATTGAFLGDLRPANFSAPFNPRGLVFGPDGKLYVTVYSAEESVVFSSDPSGYVLRFQDLTTGEVDVIAANNGDGQVTAGESRSLHNPEGLTFGPDGRLYVTSFRFNATDNGILVFDVATKLQVGSLPLEDSFAVALLFGPNDRLYVPVTGGPAAGHLRRYDVTNGTFEELTTVVSNTGGETKRLLSPWYLTFTQTNPATLAYQPYHNFVIPEDVDGDEHVAPLDALLIINELNARTVTTAAGKLPSARKPSGYFFDVDGDGFAVPLDVLRIINSLNAKAPRGAEGEPPATRLDSHGEPLTVDIGFAVASRPSAKDADVALCQLLQSEELASRRLRRSEHSYSAKRYSYSP